MSMQNRQRAELPMNEQEETIEAIWNEDHPEPPIPKLAAEPIPTVSYTKMNDLLRSVQRQQIVVGEHFSQIVRKLEDSEQEKQELLMRMNQAVHGLTKQEEELVQTIQKHQTAKERQLTQALQEVNNLKQELTRGFLEMTIRAKVPLSHQLAKIGIVSLSSLIGGIVVHLLLTLAVR